MSVPPRGAGHARDAAGVGKDLGRDLARRFHVQSEERAAWRRRKILSTVASVLLLAAYVALALWGASR